VKKLQLELVSIPADEAALQDSRANHSLVIEQAIQPSAAIKAGSQNGRMFLSFAWRPATHVKMLWS
jgi:hypothetical protein